MGVAVQLRVGVITLSIVEGTEMIKIRPATESDLPDIISIHVQSWKDAYADVLPAEFIAGQLDQELARHWRETEIQNQDIVLVAEQDTLVGFVAVWCRPVPFIDNLHVRPSHRSKKIGSALMEAVAQELIQKEHKKAYLWVFESNEKAKRFYERLGGTQKEQGPENVFGYEVLSRKIEWDDLAKIGENQ
jgi:ribosomal protein S18 acetylase RimI-like enzyme